MDKPENPLYWVDYKTVRRAGGSLVVAMPAPFVRKIGLKVGDRVKITYTDEYLKVEKHESSS